MDVFVVVCRVVGLILVEGIVDVEDVVVLFVRYVRFSDLVVFG